MSGTDDKQFEAFANASDVEVGESNLASQPAAPAPKRARSEPPRTEPAKQPAEGGAGEGDEGGETGGNAGDEGGADDDLDLGNIGDEGGDEGGEDGDESDRRRETPAGRVKRLQQERAAARTRVRELEARLAQTDVAAIEERILARLQNGGLPSQQVVDTAVSKLGPAPDPMDQVKYPLGHLDAQYIEDRTDWVAEKKLAERSDAALQRQQENQLNQAQQAEQQRLVQTVDTMAKKGAEIYDDFQETVVDAGMKGKWKMQKVTFEAAADPENEHGARVLYNLAKNPQEAERVAAMTDAQQVRYVDRKNAEIAEKIKARKIPSAGAPPQTHARGGNSRVSISPATDNLDDFEKLVRQDAAKGRR